MAKFVKKVDRLVPSTERSQVFTSADISTGDIIDIAGSIGKAASEVRITTAGSSNLTFRKNVIQTIFPSRGNDKFGGPIHGPNINTALGVEKIDDTMVAETADSDTILKGPIKDLELTWSTGTWSLVVK